MPEVPLCRLPGSQTTLVPILTINIYYKKEGTYYNLFTILMAIINILMITVIDCPNLQNVGAIVPGENTLVRLVHVGSVATGKKLHNYKTLCKLHHHKSGRIKDK